MSGLRRTGPKVGQIALQLKLIKGEIDNLILQTPTGIKRERLTEANIGLMVALQALREHGTTTDKFSQRPVMRTANGTPNGF